MKAGRILIVEDEPLWQEFLQEPLAADYYLTLASNKTEASQALKEARDAGTPFNVVTVDIGLDSNISSLEGEDILALIHQYHSSTKCIVVTGHHGVNPTRLRDYFKEFEVFDYIGKDNFDLTHFKEIVDRAFDFHGYRLLAEVGRGGMSTVYKALDYKNHNRLVALKVLHYDPRLSPDDTARRLARFTQEAETVRRLDHPNIVTIYNYSVADNPSREVFLVMEYLAGKTLETNLADLPHPTPELVISIGRQMCEALGYAHTQNVIHRDIKPSNIMLLPEGQIKITDFGIAKVKNTAPSLTRTEEIIGTLDYMPPEQILYTKEVDHRVDIYATGAVLYEMLAHQKTYPDPLLKLQQDPLPLPAAVSTLSVQLAAVVMKALSRSPDERYQSAHEMAKALQACGT